MSRTYRRTKAKKSHSRFEEDYTHRHVSEWLDIDSQAGRKYHNGFPVRPLPEKEFIKAYWKYHTDNGMPIFGWENAFERPFRNSNKELRASMKQQLSKWLKDEEYEIQFSRPPLIWDLC